MKIDSIIQKANYIKQEPGDYINEKDGFLYCGKCKTPKQMIVFGKKVKTLCKCEAEKRNKIELEEKLKQKESMLKGEISPCFQKARFENVNANKNKYAKKLKNYISNFKQGANFYQQGLGLLLYGYTGNGKTFLASCLANEMQKQGHWVIMLSMQDAVAKIQNWETKDNFIKGITGCDLLILDDFGSEAQNEYTKAQVQTIIELRSSSKKPIVITTNYNRNDMIENPSSLQQARTFDRIIEMTHGIVIEVPSVRQEQSARRFEQVESILDKGL